MLRIAGSSFCPLMLPVEFCSMLIEDELRTAEFDYCKTHNSACIEYQSVIRTSFGSVLLRHGLNFAELALYKVVRWHFSRVISEGGNSLFSSDVTNNLMYVWIILLKNDSFWISQGKVATVGLYTGEVGKCISYWCQIFSGFLTQQKSLKSLNFWQSYSKNKKVDVFWTQCTLGSAIN